MKEFQAPVEDIVFTLEHVAGASRLPGWDSELVGEIVGQFAKFAESEIAVLNEPGDRVGARLENGRVRMPEGFAAAYRQYAEQGWTGLSVPEAYGGQGMPVAVLSAVSEIFTGANHALQVVVNLAPGSVATLLAHGTESQKERFVPKIASGEWLGTMCLTEPGAGSDLAAIRTRAEKTDDGWAITGEKIFISGGDQDMSEGILHLVLARTGAPEDGVRGLSLFACPATDETGVRNAISVGRIEEKMGIHASPTCHLVFDGATAELVGSEGGGLMGMFTMMNAARLDVALQGIAHAARAADIAKSYAAERRQGRRPGVSGQAVIAQHPDIARMLTEQDALTLGGRAMCQIAHVTLETGDDPDLVDFLTPICKVFGTDAGIESANLGIQILGGYGYLKEYGVEQVWRDARITAIYEGTNGIHALSLATRMLRLKDGAVAGAFESWAEAIAHSTSQSQGLTETLSLWTKTRDRVLAAQEPEAMAHAFMKLSGLVAWQAAWQLIAEQAEHAADPQRIANLAAHVRKTGPVAARYWADMAN